MASNETVAELCEEGVKALDPARVNGWSDLFDRIVEAHRYEMNALVAHLGGDALAAIREKGATNGK